MEVVLLETLFGSKKIEKIFFYLLSNESCYGSLLATTFEEALSPFQKALDRLELGGILVSFLRGKTRVYQFNPRYPFLTELKLFLEKTYLFLPQEYKARYYEKQERTRPRRRGKPL